VSGVAGANNGGSGVAISVALRTAVDIAKHRGERAFVVGGVVRDLLMNRQAGDYDLDIVVEGDGIAFAGALAQALGAGVREHPPFLTAKLVAPFSILSPPGDILLGEVDVATARQESYSQPGALPTVEAASIDTDLWRRDFSSNAIALSLRAYQRYGEGHLSRDQILAELTDPCGGLADIQASTLRVLHPRSFIDDPTRLFRAVRYLVRLSFHFDMATLAGFVEAVKSGALSTLSSRRVWNEVLVALDEQQPAEVIQEFTQRGLFGHLPIVAANNPAWILESLENLEVIRHVIGTEMFRQAGRVILVANLLREGREDVVRAVHEGNKIIQRATTVLNAAAAPQGLRMIPDVAAAYCVHGSEELRELLQACLREVAK
jgi:tRNA nucleotidyltransferase (CCA-adding enzyme)